MTGSQFGTYIHAAPELDGGIGLTHVTDCVHLGSILGSGKLEKRWCQVFEKDLLYLFYGRPAYRRKWDSGATSNLGYARMCFVLRDAVADKAARLLPFDSGGYKHYQDAFHQTLDISDFDVAPTDHPRKIVAAFYETFSDYYWMAPRPGLKLPLTQNIVDSYYKLITGGLKETFDDRCAAIEVQLEDSLPLAGQVLAVIGPHMMFDDPHLMDQIIAWGAEPRGYQLPRMFNPAEIGGRLLDEVHRFLVDGGYL
ncbi:hypothetical protein NUH86_21645 [Sphingobium sp. JS3065]|uniref:hypothetical protein n=1 Tax=Sphingobium sp. JS3065 TaxID=2970925 RepID=UPI002264D663|nr:hypothetical protein [Sphingobium sp. JS3065]UZW57320.1 hypothetical protein NUH86_21645 [Sphingobium sp. JS3065]